MGLHIRVMISAICLFSIITFSTNANARTAAILNADLPGNDSALTHQLADTIRGAGYSVTEINAAELSGVLDPTKIDLLVLPNSAILPSASTVSIDKYLRGGGDIIALNTPMWQASLINIGGRWITKEQYQKENAASAPENPVFKFSDIDMKTWVRSSNKLENPATYETTKDGPVPGFGTLHVVVSNHQGWDTTKSPDLVNPFKNGNTLTVVTAKGDEKTKQVAIEWDEKDGSRWFASLNLSTEWRQYILKPEDFKYWSSNQKRGFSGDRFNPENALCMTIGVAFSHTGFTTGRHEYWIASLGTAKMTQDIQEVLNASYPPTLETLSPGYKFFDSPTTTKLVVRADQAITGITDLPSAEIRSSSPRPTAGGFEKGRTWRWIPLIDAQSSDGEWRGVPATYYVNTDGPYKGGVWASFSVKGSDWYKSAAAQKLIGDVARRMYNNIYMLDGGSNFYTYFKDQKMTLGIRTANISTTDVPNFAGRVMVTDLATGKQKAIREWDIKVLAGANAVVSTQWKPESWPKKGFKITAELLDGDKVIDTAMHEAYVWTPKAKKEFITVKDGDFMLNGKRWRANGVNYMPSSGIAIEDGPYFEDWIGFRAYDPEVIERDIRHMKDIGLNSVSIFAYHSSIKAQNLLDLLRRLDNHGMKANLSMRPGTPMDFLWPQMKEIIQHYKLKENDTVFAYDLAWEPWHGTHDARKTWDGDWVKWVTERYGSIENAEKDWGCSITRDESGKITNPNPENFADDKDHVMIAAYRRFLDTILYKKYDAARRLVKSIDPNHSVSFRMSEAGNPTFYWMEALPYDFPYLGAAVDIMAPEGYGRIGDWENVKPGWFEYEYARYAAPTKPLFWAEIGYSAWDMSSMSSTKTNLDFQGRFINDFYKMMTLSGADGAFFWWYPGGFRYGENSDYGIINPDGTDRPTTKAIRANASAFFNGPPAKQVDTWLTMDRDKYPVGIGGVYDSLKDAFWAAIDKGKAPGLRTAGTGTDSSNCPLIAVGNTKYNGSNPLKFLDGTFDVVEIRGADGKWKSVENGGTIKVNPNRSVVARIHLTNLGDAAWLAPAEKTSGAVWLTVNGTKTKQPMTASVPRHGSVVLNGVVISPSGLRNGTSVTIGLIAEGRASFGERFTVTLMK